MIKVIICDLDDTLLNSTGVVSYKNRIAIEQCKNKGIKIGYITARSPKTMKDLIGELPCDFIANYNGAQIIIENNIVRNEMSYEDGINFITKILKLAPDIVLSAHFEPYVLYDDNIMDNNSIERFDRISLNLPRANFQRIRLELGEYSDINLSKCISENLLYYYTKNNSSIIVNKQATKGNVVKLICEYYGISNNEVIAFGDDTIDIDMLKSSGTGVAMENAVEKVKEVADYITLSNDKDGVAYYIEKYVL